jgi:hypothetical protein
MRAQAEIQFDGDYDDVCDLGAKSFDLFTDAYNISIGTGVNICVDEDSILYQQNGDPAPPFLTGTAPLTAEDTNGRAWGATIELSDGTWFCVDSSGAALELSARSITINSGASDKTCD